MASKKKDWRWLKGKYPALVKIDDPSYEDVIRAALDEVQGKPLDVLAALYNDARELKADIEAKLSAANAQIEAMERAILRKLETENLEQFGAHGYRFSAKSEPYASVKDRAAFMEWAIENYRDNLSLHWQTLNGVVKAALEAEEELPPGVEVFVKSSVDRRKA